MRLAIRELTPDAFNRYGKAIHHPPSKAVASGDGWSWWSETARLPQIDRPYAVGYLALRPCALQFDWAERHMLSCEAIIPLGGDCLIYVAPSGDLPVWEHFEVFLIRCGNAVLLSAGVWHGAPFAIDHPISALVLLRQGTGVEDTQRVTRNEGAVGIVHNTAVIGEGEQANASC